MKTKNGTRVRIRDGWYEQGKEGTALGEIIEVNGADWVPVLWDNSKWPSFRQTIAVERADKSKGKKAPDWKGVYHHTPMNTCVCGGQMISGVCQKAARS